jgi:putative ABC transport system permease protein
MISPRWRKILRDIWRNKRRTILVVLSITVGVFAVGTVAIMRDIATGDMIASYEAANPPSAIVYVNGSFDDRMLESARRIDGVDQAEGRQYVVVTFQHPQSETWYPLQLYAVPDYDCIRIGKLQREETFSPAPDLWPNPSVYPPPAKQILLERTSCGNATLVYCRLHGHFSIEHSPRPDSGGQREQLPWLSAYSP